MIAPRLHSGHVRVRVPATSANLGPGYDCLGLALDWHDEVDVSVADKETTVDVDGEGAADVPRDRTHLVVQAMDAAFARMHVPAPALHLHCHNCIPHGRGLGSSAAAVVSGVMAARALVQDGATLLTDEDVLKLATRLDGHPDNVAAALLGGLTLSWSDTTTQARSLPVADDVVAIVAVPPTSVQTRQARAVLPVDVPHRDAAANVARAALLVHALCAEPGLLLEATHDVLHQPYRRAVMPASLDFVDHLRGHGVAAVLSGAGPTVLAFATRAAADAVRRQVAGGAPAGWAVQRLAVERAGVQVSVA